MNTAPPKITPPSMVDRAYEAIRNQILQGRFHFGEALSRREIAHDLGISVLPISAALRRLEEEGVVESRPQVGTRLCIPTEADIRDRVVVREALESQAARLFAERASLPERRELRLRAEQLDTLFVQRDAAESDSEFRFRLNSEHLQFHMRIAECSGSRSLCHLIEKNDVLMYNWLFDLMGEQPPTPPRFHRDLMDRVSSADVEAADAAMRAHVRYGLEATIQSAKRIEAQADQSWRLRRESRPKARAGSRAAR